MKKLRYILINGLMFAAAYYGFAEGVTGVKNIFMVVAWFVIILSLILFLAMANDELKKKVAKDHEGLAFPVWLNATCDISLALFIAWHGAIFTCFFWLLHAFLLYCARVNINEACEELKQKEAKSEATK